MDIICDGPKVAIKVIWHHTRVTHVVHGHEVHVQGSVGEGEDGIKQYYVHSKCKISELSLIKGEANNCLVFMDTLLSLLKLAEQSTETCLESTTRLSCRVCKWITCASG